MADRDNYIVELFQDDSKIVAQLQHKHSVGAKTPNDSLHKLLKEKEQEIAELKKEVSELKQELNKTAPEEPDTQMIKKSRVAGIFYNIMFYGVLFSLVVGAILLAGRDGTPRNFFGYSYFTVLTSSMQREIPKGSLVITHKTDPAVLQIGDTITFMNGVNTTITHKIVGIYENYDGKGNRGFQTQGVENVQPDSDMVDASNVVGKVIFSLPKAGAVLAVIGDNLVYCIIFFVLLLLLTFSLQVFFRNRKKEKINLV